MDDNTLSLILLAKFFNNCNNYNIGTDKNIVCFKSLVTEDKDKNKSLVTDSKFILVFQLTDTRGKIFRKTLELSMDYWTICSVREVAYIGYLAYSADLDLKYITEKLLFD